MILQTDVDADYVEMVDSVLSDWSQRQSARPAEHFDRNLWSQLEELGLTRLTGSEATGGSGAGWTEAEALHRLCGYYAVPLPLIEHDLLAGWLGEQVGRPVDGRVTTVGTARGSEAGAVAGGLWAERVFLLVERAGWSLVDLDPRAVPWTLGTNLAGEPRDVPQFDMENAIPIDEYLVEEFRMRGALGRALQICGALQRCVDLAVEYAAVREQFGRPLKKFQAVQILLADSASETALAQASTLAAAELLDQNEAGFNARRRAVAVAKSNASHAAGVVARHAHQVFGAIGTTTEHSLATYTTRLLSWRDEYGTRDEWDRVLYSSAGSSRGAAWRTVTGE